MAQHKGVLVPATRTKPAIETMAVTEEMKSAERAYYRLRLERTNAKHLGKRVKRAADAEAAEKDKAK